MGQQVRNCLDWARRRKISGDVFCGLTLAVGIMIGSVVSGRVSAMKTLSFAGTNATPLAVPDPIPAASSFSGIVTRVEPAVVNIATTQVLERKPLRKKRRTPPQARGRAMATIPCRISSIGSSTAGRMRLRRPNAAWVPA